eukprot:IDg960t1
MNRKCKSAEYRACNAHLAIVIEDTDAMRISATLRALYSETVCGARKANADTKRHPRSARAPRRRAAPRGAPLPRRCLERRRASARDAVPIKFAAQRDAARRCVMGLEKVINLVLEILLSFSQFALSHMRDLRSRQYNAEFQYGRNGCNLVWKSLAALQITK